MIWRGDVYQVDVGQPVGHEPAFARPAVIASANIINNGPGGLVIIVPITTIAYGLRSHVELEPEGSGLEHTSYARCDQVRVVAAERLSAHLGTVDPEQMATIDRALRFVLDL